MRSGGLRLGLAGVQGSGGRGPGLQPAGQGGRLVKGKHGAGTGRGVQPLGEMGLDAGGFVAEGQRPHPGRQAGGQALGVAGRLELHPGQRGALLFGFDHAGSSAIDIQQVVGHAKAGVERKLADGHPFDRAAAGMDVGVRQVADVPAGCC